MVVPVAMPGRKRAEEGNRSQQCGARTQPGTGNLNRQNRNRQNRWSRQSHHSTSAGHTKRTDVGRAGFKGFLSMLLCSAHRTLR